jgi:hypothetical protein
MRRIYFGSIENLHIEEGDPVLDPPPRIFHEIKFGGVNAPPSDTFWRDFYLKAQVVEFFNFLNDVRHGVIHRIEIKHGLPFRVVVAQDAPRGD